MINISNSKHLDIILPNSNKALSTVLTNATTKELETLTQGKDLKTIMGDILKSSSENSTSNKTLLNLVKNNPTLQNLGNVTTTIKDLLKALELPKTVNVDAKLVDTKTIQEVKTANLNTKLTDAKTIQEVKTANLDTKLTDTKTTQETKTPLPIEKVLKELLVDIKDLKPSDLKPKIDSSGIFLESKLKDVKNPLQELKNTLNTLLKTVESSSDTSVKPLLKQLNQVFNSEVLKATTDASITKENPKAITTTTLTKLSAEINSLSTQLKTVLKSADTLATPLMEKALVKLEQTMKQLSPENFKVSTIQEALTPIQMQVAKSLTVESKGLLGALEKIFTALKAVDQAALPPKASLEQLITKNVPQEIDKLSQTIKSAVEKMDPIFQKETRVVLSKLETLNTPQKLVPQANVKEILTNDLKALLLQSSSEVAKSSHPNQGELLKNMDKLALQIDNYQLVSHLSNSSCLYIPFSWDNLEEGNIEFKKAEDEKFYCDIDLKLKEYGELNLKLTLYDKNQLNLHIYSANEDFKELIRDEIPALRSALIDLEITPREIRLFAPKTKAPPSPYQTQYDNLNMGFEIKA